MSTQIVSRQRVRDRAEVYTHEREVTAMLDLVPDMFPDDTLRGVQFRFLEPACGSGNFLEEILRRKLRPIRFATIRDVGLYECWLLRALASVYAVDIRADSVEQSRERLLALLFGHYGVDAGAVEPAEGFSLAARAIVTANVVRGDTLAGFATSGKRFDVIVGNPPYQVGTRGFGATASPVYHRFVELAIDLNPRYVLMIIPSRWFSGGKGLGEFRARMIADRRISKLVDNPKIYDCFPDVKIRGGVNYFLWDREHDGDCEFATRINGQLVSSAMRDLRNGDGVLVRDGRAMGVIRKATLKSTERVEHRCMSTNPFGVATNHPGGAPAWFEGAIPLIYATRVGYSRLEQLRRHREWVDRWKVLLPMASSGDTVLDRHGRIVDVVLGEPIALAPGSACTQSYFIAGMFDSRAETENYAHYLATKFVRFLVLQRKTTQQVHSARFRFVPMMDMTRRWTDRDLYAEFGLDQEEIEHVEASIKPRSVNLSLDSPIPASHLPGGKKHRVAA